MYGARCIRVLAVLLMREIEGSGTGWIGSRDHVCCSRVKAVCSRKSPHALTEQNSNLQAAKSYNDKVLLQRIDAITMHSLFRLPP